MEGAQCKLSKVEEVFGDFKARQAALIKALTTDVEEFYQQCDPEKENLCLYGHSTGEWEVSLPADEVPPEIPEPTLGINFARDGMEEKDWLSLVAVHSDAWLFSVAIYFSARLGFDKADRKQLLNMINEMQTVYEVVNGTAKKQANGKSSASNHNNFVSSSKAAKYPKALPPKDENEGSDEVHEEDDEEHEEEGDNETFCGACDGNYGTSDEFWIGCDVCEKWFHGKCVKVTPARAEHIKHYKCPSCSNKRART